MYTFCYTVACNQLVILQYSSSHSIVCIEYTVDDEALNPFDWTAPTPSILRLSSLFRRPGEFSGRQRRALILIFRKWSGEINPGLPLILGKTLVPITDGSFASVYNLFLLTCPFS